VRNCARRPENEAQRIIDGTCRLSARIRYRKKNSIHLRGIKGKTRTIRSGEFALLFVVAVAQGKPATAELKNDALKPT
jgi:hypothetical protein